MASAPFVFCGTSSHRPTTSLTLQLQVPLFFLQSQNTSTTSPSHLSSYIPLAVENNNEPLPDEILEPRHSQRVFHPPLKLMIMFEMS